MTSLNGSPVTPDQLESLAMVNYGHFTSLQVEDGTIRGFTHHLERLVSDCRAVFGAELNREKIRTYIKDEVHRSGLASLGIRVTIFDPGIDMGRPALAGQPSALVSVRPPAPATVPPLTVKSAEYRRELPAVKHIGLFGALTQRRDAQVKGFGDALFADGAGFISEGPTWNIGFFDGSQIVWPDAETLPGVTMRLLKQVHEDSVEAPVNLADISGMRAAFATNVTIGVRPISRIDELEFPADASIIDTLRNEFAEIPGEEL